MFWLPLVQQTVWYGPATVSFPVCFAGNPQDPEENNVRVVFTGPKGKSLERIAYFDTESGEYRATLVTDEPGTYAAKLTRNGQPIYQPSNEPVYSVINPITPAYIKFRDGKFIRADGKPFYPFGYNLAWHREGEPPLETSLKEMADMGLTWTRIWASHWDKKNPWWGSESNELMNEEVILRLQRLVEGSKVPIQLALFDSRALSDGQWPQHPWNAVNGGFLQKPTEFFTNPEAKRRAKMWIRQATARMASSPNLFAWELLARADQANSNANSWSEIEAWAKEMAEAIRGGDPMGHPITMGGTLPADFGKAFLDFDSKSGFQSEVLPLGNSTPEQQIVRGLLTSVLNGGAGADQWWAWEKVDSRLKELYKQLSGFAQSVRTQERFNAKPLSLILLGGKATIQAVGNSDWMAIHSISTDPKDTGRELRGIFLKDGEYEAEIWDLASLKRETRKIIVKSYVIKGLVEGGKSTLIQVRKK